MIWKSIPAIIWATVISGTLVECSKVVVVLEGEPGAADAQAFIQESVVRNSDGRLKLISLTKTGGRRINGPESNTYELWYDADVELTRDALWSPSPYRRFSTLPPDSKGGVLYTPGKQGEQVKIPGALVFAKGTNGWTIQPDERYE